MLEFCAKEFIALMSELEELTKALEADDPDFSVLGENWDQIGELLERASSWCKLLEFTASQELINHIKLRRDEWTVKSLNEAKENIKMLKDIIKAELDKRLFMFIPQDDANWYEKEDGFGIEVSEAFRSAIEDIKEAGNCFATGRYTASVFHLMRVLEHGLRALAKDVGLTFEKSTWGGIIKMIEDKIEDFYKTSPKTPSEIERSQFLSEAATDFRYFKNSWRDHVSHLRYTCKDREEALLILNHVKSFMNHLSKRLGE
jgi:hypothetical protein